MGAAIPLRRDISLGEGYHSPQVEVAVRLNTNESPLPPPKRWTETVAAELGRIDFNRYPDRSARALRDAIGTYHGVDADRVFAGKGSNEVLQCLLLAYGGRERRAATFEPTYTLHSHIARLTGTQVVSGRRGDDFRLNLGEVESIVVEHDPDIVFVCSPNNPTGGAEPEGTVRAVLDMARGLVVVDEAYGQFAPWSAVDLAALGVGGLVVVRTFSKTWAMAGCRLGYLLADPEIVRACSDVALPYHLDTFAQLAGRLALQFGAEMDRRVALIVEERGRVAAALGVLDVDQWPSDSNFILFRPRGRAGGEVWKALVEKSVLVRNCDSWPGLEGCLRVTVGTPEENEAFLAALTAVLGA